MRKLLFVLCLVLAGCRSEGDWYLLTATPDGNATIAPSDTLAPTHTLAPMVTNTYTPPATIDPTPTMEDVTTATPDTSWDIGCVEPGIRFVNPNPCLSGIISQTIGGYHHQVPLTYAATFGTDIYGVTQYTDIIRQANGFGVDLLYFAGSAGLALDPLELNEGTCYQLVVRGYSNINVNNYQQAIGNFFLVAKVTVDGRVYTLSQQQMCADCDLITMTMSGERVFLFPFHTIRHNPTVTLEILVRAIWGTAGHGSYWRFESIVIEEPDDLNVCSTGATF